MSEFLAANCIINVCESRNIKLDKVQFNPSASDKKLINKNQKFHFIGRDKTPFDSSFVKFIKRYRYFFLHHVITFGISKKLPFQGVVFVFSVEVDYIRQCNIGKSSSTSIQYCFVYFRIIFSLSGKEFQSKSCKFGLTFYVQLIRNSVPSDQPLDSFFEFVVLFLLNT